MTERDGTRTFYGDVPEARLSDGAGRVAAWYVTRKQDVHGNEVVYSYERDPRTTEVRLASDGLGRLLSRRSSTWEPPPDPIVSARAGFPTRIEHRVTSIALQVQRGDTARPSHVSALRLAATACLAGPGGRCWRVSRRPASARTAPSARCRRVAFGYGDADLSRARWRAIGGDVPSGRCSSRDVTLVRQSGSGLPDILETRPTGHYLRVNMGEGSLLPARIGVGAGAGRALRPGDVSLGHGRRWLRRPRRAAAAVACTRRPTSRRVGRHVSSGAWRRRSTSMPPDVRLADLTGNGLPDALRSGVSGWIFFENLGERTLGAAPRLVVERSAVATGRSTRASCRRRRRWPGRPRLRRRRRRDGLAVARSRPRSARRIACSARLHFGIELRSTRRAVRRSHRFRPGRSALRARRRGPGRVQPGGRGIDRADGGGACAADLAWVRRGHRHPRHGRRRSAATPTRAAHGGSASCSPTGPLDLLVRRSTTGLAARPRSPTAPRRATGRGTCAAGQPWRTGMPIARRVVEPRDHARPRRLAPSWQTSVPVRARRVRRPRSASSEASPASPQLDREAPRRRSRSRLRRRVWCAGTTPARTSICATSGSPCPARRSKTRSPTTRGPAARLRGLLRREETYALDGDRRPYLVTETAYRAFAVGRSLAAPPIGMGAAGDPQPHHDPRARPPRRGRARC